MQNCKKFNYTYSGTGCNCSSDMLTFDSFSSFIFCKLLLLLDLRGRTERQHEIISLKKKTSNLHAFIGSMNCNGISSNNNT